MPETTVPHYIPTVQCQCGKQGDEITNCMICAEYRSKSLPQQDSFFMSAIKLALVEAFFHPQYYNSPNGGGGSYGGQAQGLIQQIMGNPAFAAMIKSLEEFIISKEDEWKELAVATFMPLVKTKAKNMVDTWAFNDKMKNMMDEIAASRAKDILMNDPLFMEKIKKAATNDNYRLEFDIKVKIIEEKTLS